MPDAFLPAKAITQGPKFHWFGYYDKLQFDPTGRYVLSMEVDFEHRSPSPDDVIRVGMVDLQDECRWIELGQTRAWCWQQGCMLQWLPGSDRQVIWNDRVGARFSARIVDVQSGGERTLPMPVYTISPDGRTAFCPDFSRVNEMRPGYGYAGIPDPHREVAAPADSGIWRLDLESGEAELIVSIAQIAAIPYPHGDQSGCKHYFNHLLISPDGARLEFLHRWRRDEGPTVGHLMYTVKPDGSDLRVADGCGYTSHFIWRDSERLLAWSRAASQRGDFCRFNVFNGEFEAVGSELMTRDGHVNCLPGSDWLVNDSYPSGEHQRQLYLYHVPSGRRIDIGSFHSPPEYADEWRCDLHPRLSPDGHRVTIDSVHQGNGRQIYLLDINEIVGA